MSKIKAFITTLILTTSSAAMADATFSASTSARVSFGTSYSQPVVIRDHRRPASRDHAPVARPSYSTASWQTLAGEMITNRGALEVYPSSSMVLSHIRLETLNATAMIEGVTVFFTDGSSQYFQPSNKTLDMNNPTFGIQLNNRVVARISINAWSARAEAQFRVMGYGRSIQAQPAPYPTPAPTYELSLAQNLTFSRTGRLSINVQRETRSLRTLRLQSVSGSMSLDMVTVRYADGSSQTFDNIDRLRIGETAELKLIRNKQIMSIVVSGDAARSRGALSIFAV